MASSNNTQNSRASVGTHDRKLRYRALLENIAVLEEDEASSNMERMDKTAQVVRDAQALLSEGNVDERIEHPGEGYLDSRVLRATSELAIRCSEAVSSNANMYDRHELATHIRENPHFWESIFPREAPPTCSLFGTFAPTPLSQRPRTQRARAARQHAPLKEPEKVHRLDKEEEGSEMVSRVNKFVKRYYRERREPINYFHLVIDPDSFSRTVENIYNVSFLVRDAKLKVDLDEELGLPFVTPVPEQEGPDLSDENQFIVSLDMKRWKELIDAFQIRKPLMILKR